MAWFTQVLFPLHVTKPTGPKIDEGIWRVCRYCGELQSWALAACDQLTADVDVRVMDLIAGGPPGRDEAAWQHLLRKFTGALRWLLELGEKGGKVDEI